MQGESQANTLCEKRERDEYYISQNARNKDRKSRRTDEEREKEEMDGKKRRLVKLRAAYTLCCQSLPDTLYSVGDMATPFAP